MQKIICCISLFLLLGTSAIHAQSPYVATEDTQHPGEYILNGIITKYALQNNPAYSWYGSSQNEYNPNPEYVDAMRAAVGKVKFIVFGGTWCSDTRYILPKFFKLQDVSGFPDADISFFATDRSKKTIGNITNILGVTHVPTLIVMKEGKEIGRVVEYGTTGEWDKELIEILK